MERENGLPADWRERIKNKKVIFYNTSIANLLSGGEKHIAKIAHTLEAFRTQNEVVLWWRPHPLELSTIESMRSDLAVKYKEIRKKYEEEEWGILDTSADVHRAIAVSDAYYGDWSSVIQLYRKTGKPVLISDDNVNDGISIEIMDMVYYKQKIWFLAWNFNCLFSIDIKTQDIELVGKIPCDSVLCSYLSNAIINEKDILVFLPANGSSIVRYNVSEKMFTWCSVNENKKSKYIGFAKIGEYCYLLPAHENRILKYNIFLNRIEGEVPIGIQSEEIKCKRRTLIDNSQFYFICEKSNKIGRYDTTNDKIEYLQIGENKNQIYFIEKYKAHYYIITQNHVEIINEYNMKTEEILEFPKEFISGETVFIDYVKDGNVLYLLPYLSNMVIAVNMKTKNILGIQKKCEDSFAFLKYICGCIVGQTIYAYSAFDNCLHLIDIENKSETKFSLRLTTKQIQEMMAKHKEDILYNTYNYSIQENGLVNLSNFIEIIKRNNSANGSRSNLTICGERIHNEIIGED